MYNVAWIEAGLVTKLGTDLASFPGLHVERVALGSEASIDHQHAYLCERLGSWGAGGLADSEGCIGGQPRRLQDLCYLVV